MNRQTAFLRSEKGQAIVIVAGVMVGLLVLAGLAIDGGNLFLQRRNTQNAADASALAGTRLLAEAICSHAGATDAAIDAVVDQYAQRNHVEDLSGLMALYTDIHETELGEVGAGSIPVGASGVLVEIQNNVETYFMKVVGIRDVEVGASALAMTGQPEFLQGLRPVGVPWDLVNYDPGTPFTINFGNCAQKPEDCNVEIYPYTGEQVQHRGWLNLAYIWNDNWSFDERPEWKRADDSSGDASVLKEWMENGYPGPNLWTGDYIHAKPGTNSSVIGEAPVDAVIAVPVFDRVDQYDDVRFHDEDYHTASVDEKPADATQGGGYYYHIHGFLAFTVTAKSQGGGWITGEVAELIGAEGNVSSSDFEGYGQENACENHMQAINLWK